MAVVQDDAAAAAVRANHSALRSCRSRLFCTDLRWLNCAMLRGCRERSCAGRLGGRQLSYFIQCAIASPPSPGWWRAAEPPPDLGGELSLLIGVTGGQVSPGGRGDEAGEADGFGVDRREQPGGAERRRLGARRDEDLGAAGPPR